MEELSYWLCKDVKKVVIAFLSCIYLKKIQFIFMQSDQNSTPWVTFTFKQIALLSLDAPQWLSVIKKQGSRVPRYSHCIPPLMFWLPSSWVTSCHILCPRTEKLNNFSKHLFSLQTQAITLFTFYPRLFLQLLLLGVQIYVISLSVSLNLILDLPL